MPPTLSKPSKKKDLGDFQTPRALIAQILDSLRESGDRPQRVLEPTCGEGGFIAEFLDRPDPPREIRGIEIQASYAKIARSLVDPTERVNVRVDCHDLFAIDLQTDLRWSSAGPLLVVGNLPWVTTAALGASGGLNGPARTNSRRLRGIDAMTGESNFDISEAIWLKLIRELASEGPTIALLCKSTVARTILRGIATDDLPITKATLWKIDAKRWFNASVSACLLHVEVGSGPKATVANVYGELGAKVPASTLLLEKGRLIADMTTYQTVGFADGPCPLQWRQGIKHDACSIMELSRDVSGSLRNRLGEIVEVEREFVYPLTKATDLAGSRNPRPKLEVIVTQKRLGEDTRDLERSAPRLWSYLQAHRDAFERRKSSIYRGRPPFSMFGVGDYSFAPYKVAVSGLHKIPRFRIVGPVDAQPTMLDDTCYFLPCRTVEQANLLEALPASGTPV
jgi:hypothetical protein